MNKNKLYFYKRTIKPNESEGLKYYQHGRGIVGFKSPQHKGELLLYGTQEELETYLGSHVNSTNRSNNGYDRRTVSKGRLY